MTLPPDHAMKVKSSRCPRFSPMLSLAHLPPSTTSKSDSLAPVSSSLRLISVDSFQHLSLVYLLTSLYCNLVNQLQRRSKLPQFAVTQNTPPARPVHSRCQISPSPTAPVSQAPAHNRVAYCTLSAAVNPAAAIPELSHVIAALNGVHG